MTEKRIVELSYFSDVLCIWAYAAQIRLEEIKKSFADKVNITYHYISVFGSTHEKIGHGWKDRGEFNGYSEHVKSIAADMSHIQVHPRLWLDNIPPSSAGCHAFLKAIQILENAGELVATSKQSISEAAAWQMRLAFFKEAKNIGALANQIEIAEQLKLPVNKILDLLNSGEAYAVLCSDASMQTKYLIEGSPTFSLNDGRQKLYGNVGYRIIEANIQELLEKPQGQASWC